MKPYDQAFFNKNIGPGLSSAAIVLPGLLPRLDIVESVVDIGCSVGHWLSIARQLDCRIHGVDGYAPDQMLLIEPGEFERCDLEQGFDCSGYDLAISLEVGEHLPESAAESLVSGLCKAQYVLFSAAIPGQGGVNHVNEQWSSWWASLFAKHGYVGSCDLRWQHWLDRRVEICYRQNMVLWGTPANLAIAGFVENVVDVVHPELWDVVR